MTVVAEFAADSDRVWQLWADPRQLERWWGPPAWPASFYRYSFEVGGNASYYMTGPDGTKAHGWWRFTEIQAPSTIALDDGFADENGEPSGEHGVIRMTAKIEPVGASSRMTLTSAFESAAQLEDMLAMGMEQGIREAVGQIDAILA